MSDINTQTEQLEELPNAEVTQELDNILDKIEDIKDNRNEVDVTNDIDDNTDTNSEVDTNIEEEPVAENDINVVEEEVKEPKSKKDSKLWKIKNKAYSLQAENEELKKLLGDSIHSNNYQYGKNVHTDFNAAKARKKEAILTGDIDSLIDADINLNRAIHNLSEVENWSNSTTEPKETKASNDFGEIEEEIATEWLESHQNLKPTSNNYDINLATKVSEYVNYLDRELSTTGRQDVIFSSDYFDAIENYISELKTTEAPVKKSNNNHIGDVKKSYSSQGVTKKSNNKQIKLTAEEKDLLEHLSSIGISEKDYIRSKLNNKG